jgi:pimeloyl-ACP methyl ester carboxylesterase
VSQTPPLATEQPAVRPYRDRFITLDDVRLYVADWGGTGPLLVFLPGFGSGAHIFDGLASAFTDRFHVVAVTPRGFPPSSAPDTGYTIAQLADDVRGLLDSLGARSAVLAGHSISGAVITRFAEAYPNRLRAAVYLDAAFDFGEAYRNSRTAPRMGPPGSLDTTAARYRAWRKAYPDWDPIRETDAQMWDLDSAEVARRQRLAWALAEEVRSAPHEFWKVQVPALSICALGSLERSYGWMTPDSTRWDSVVAYAKEALPRQSTRCNEFRRRVPQGQSIALDSGHFVFLDRRDAVVQAMRRFLRAALR